ncbi:mannose-1-phosphate guanylyltransferase/mannose-6-phosphate isomerase [Microvirga lenta]|uniref:mannose-1-phosphate guanylyltransferase/mannose-6-phosphate isomerase n=1 Tax=Microvirga lenta TaxID=2881337 RepID=UPI001CFE92E3|nr:mannose-1-phosphate guanylyltransferase/mannose-6-phosphate isomerase [Microvirga lenta]MCB5173877.1 mannose-1-phosphate guanylyltransferase/mannose-6-phosphate isomerase [Microvirga lenta]
MGKIIPVLLSGGVGARLWPLSDRVRPKQFLPLIGSMSPFQEAVQRVCCPSLFEAPLIIASLKHQSLVAEQIRSAGNAVSKIILEPTGRNTAPAATIAAMIAARTDPDGIMLLMPTDHSISDIDGFRSTVAAGLEAAKAGAFVLFGISPNAPSTGFGYVHIGKSQTDGSAPRKVLAFKEKPDAETAAAYLRSGEYLWNSGIFLLPVREFLAEMERLEPGLLRSCEIALASCETDQGCLRLDAQAYAEVPSLSIDHAVMEKTDRAVILEAQFSWRDLGTWSALWEASAKNQDGTAAHGETILCETRNCYVRSEGPVIAALGIQGLVVVATQEIVLIMDKRRDQEITALVELHELSPGSKPGEVRR